MEFIFFFFLIEEFDRRSVGYFRRRINLRILSCKEKNNSNLNKRIFVVMEFLDILNSEIVKIERLKIFALSNVIIK